MEEFQYELTSSTSITIRYNYGGEYFTFNLFLREGTWTIHPFDGMLLSNRQICSIVLGELFKNKSFHVLLAREHILFSDIRSSIDLDSSVKERHPAEDAFDPINNFIQQHTLSDILNTEKQQLQEKIDLYNQILQRMFMENLGPSDSEFSKVQQIVRIFETASRSLSALEGPLSRNNRFF